MHKQDNMYYHRFSIREHKLVLAGNADGISHLFIDNATKTFTIDEAWKSSELYFSEAIKQLEEFFDGKRTTFNLKLNSRGTDYQKKVWQALEAIPYGECYSYKDVATLIGNPKASRAVGLANNRNPIPLLIPCHRVVGSNKKLVGYAYGLELKQELIDHELINKMFQKLAAYYGKINRNDLGNRKSWWPAKNSFEMMLGAILTQNTNWKNVEKALANLQEQLSPQFILDTKLEDLAELIRPSGYHNQKAMKLKNLTIWFKSYDFEIEKAKQKDLVCLREELLNINGVGGETADSILVYALNKTSFVIDAYTRRIIHRMGILVPDKYDDFREMMERFVPRNVDTYDYFHGLIVEHAKAFCTKNPQCELCPLKPHCKQNIEPSQKK